MATEAVQEAFQTWAIVDVFGHQRFAGLVSEQTIGGASFVRIDVPAIDGQPAFTKLFGASAIYGITPVSEEIAKGMAGQMRKRPIDVFELPRDLQKRLALAPRTDAEKPCPSCGSYQCCCDELEEGDFHG